VEDAKTSTVAICELKWGRKPYSVIDHISRDAELVKGTRQLQMIQTFPSEHPDFLRVRGFLQKTMTEYRRVEYLLIARDHFKWIPSNERRQIRPEIRARFEKPTIADLSTAATLNADPDERERLEPILAAVWPKCYLGASQPGATLFPGAVTELKVTVRYFQAVFDGKVHLPHKTENNGDLSGGIKGANES
jgi:hypothetical protein